MQKTSLKQSAYFAIKAKILNCEYMPNSFLNEDLLCEEFGMSRTPIRDALGRLEQENLISIMPKKGFFVSPFSITEINMVFEGRMLIEPYILLHYCKDFPDRVLAHMHEILQQSRALIGEQTKALYTLDNEFHSSIISQCPNHYLTRAYDDIQNQNHRLRIISGSLNGARLTETLDEHAAILQGLSNHDINATLEAINQHLQNAREAVFRAIAQGGVQIGL